MADLEAAYAALRNADAAATKGDASAAEDAHKLADYIKTQQAEPEPAKSGFAAKAARKEAAANPTEGGSFLRNVAEGVGQGVTSVGRGVKQAFDDGAAALEKAAGSDSLIGKAGKAMGLLSAKSIQKNTQSAVDEAKKLDAPLMNTAGGKVGSVVGTAAAALPASMIPGANTAVGATLVGGALGAAQPVATGESRTQNAALGAAGGLAGQQAGKMLGNVFQDRFAKAGIDLAKQKALNTEKDAAVAAARDAGYVLPPSQANPSTLNGILEGISGKIKTGQGASIKNQDVTNSLIRKGLGLADAAPLSRDTMAAVRNRAVEQGYAPINRLGSPFQATKEYHAAIDGLGAATEKMAEKYPGLVSSKELETLKTSLKVSEMDPEEAIALTRLLREKASDFLSPTASGSEKTVGRAYRQASDAVEGMVEANLESMGRKELLTDFREARKLIAKTFTVEKAITPGGNVDAQKLAGQLAKGRPLSGEIKQVAEFAGRFKDAARTPEKVGSHLPIDALDVLAMIGSGLASGSFGGAGAIVARPAARAAILSKPINRLMTAPRDYAPSAMTSGAAALTNSLPLQRALPLLGAATAPRLMKDGVEEQPFESGVR